MLETDDDAAVTPVPGAHNLRGTATVDAKASSPLKEFETMNFGIVIFPEVVGTVCASTASHERAPAYMRRAAHV